MEIAEGNIIGLRCPLDILKNSTLRNTKWNSNTSQINTNLPQVHRIDVGSVAYQQLGDLEVAVGARIMQRHEAKMAC